jgi:hypothetical protein
LSPVLNCGAKVPAAHSRFNPVLKEVEVSKRTFQVAPALSNRIRFKEKTNSFTLKNSHLRRFFTSHYFSIIQNRYKLPLCSGRFQRHEKFFYCVEKSAIGE